MKTLQGISWARNRLGISTHGVYRLCRRGVIPHVKVGQRTMFDEDELDIWIREGGTRKRDESPQIEPAADGRA